MYDFAFFDQPIDRLGTSCEKWDMLMEREGRELLPMWVADMDFRCADEIVAALQKRAAHPVYGYTEPSNEAVEALLSFLQRRHGLTLTAEQQLLLPCVVTGLKAAVRAFTKTGDRVIVQSPVYGPSSFPRSSTVACWPTVRSSATRTVGIRWTMTGWKRNARRALA